MSAFLLGIGFRADMGTCARKLVLLKLIDACDDDGTRIFPAISTVARAAQCSERQVQREIKAFLDVGLIRLVREGGKGPRSTNEYAMDLRMLQRLGLDGWNAVTGDSAAESKGDTVSPLDGDDKGDIGDTERVTPETDKGDIACHPTPPEPSFEPSIERERASEPEESENRKSIERAFERAFRAWPTSISDSRPEALKAWLALSPDERLAAESEAARYVEASRSAGRKHVVSHAVYLREKRWTQLPAAIATKVAAVLEAAPFGKLWQADRLKRLFAGPDGRMAIALTAFERSLVDSGKVDERTLLLEKQARVGFPAVKFMHDRAMNGQGVTVSAALEPLADLMEAVWPGTDPFEQWMVEHERRGWPWLPHVRSDKPVFFPAGGPADGLEAFELVLRELGSNREHEKAA